MQSDRLSTGPIRFGVFELDLFSGELRKRGVKVKLQEQPFQVLQILLERPGEVVTREELQKRIWPANTFVDFDKGLYSAIKKLREAVGDDAGAPRYIETVPKRGYRFIASINEAPSSLAETQSGPVLVTATATAETGNRDSYRPGLWKYLVVSAFLLSLAAAPVWNWRQRVARRLTEKDTIVLADFANTTGDADFDDTLKTALSISLRQSPFLNVLPDSNVARILPQMLLAPGARLTPEVARELCQRAGSKAYIAGSISSLGSEFVLALKAVNCESGDMLAQEQATAISKEKVLAPLGEVASKLRAELGESLATLQKFDVPLEQATTSSLEALKAYSLEQKIDNEKGPAAALPYGQRAIQLDPAFATGYAAMGSEYFSLGELERAREYYTKAFQLLDHASEREKGEITADYYSNVTGELDKAAQAFEEELESYPRDARAYEDLGVIYASKGQYDKAAEITRQAVQLVPDQVGPYENLANANLALGRFDDVLQIVQQAQRRKIDDGNLHAALYALAFVKSNTDAMAEQEQWFAGKPEEDLGLALAADTEAVRGHLSKARELTNKAVDSAIKADSKETGAISLAIAAQREAACGNATEARKMAVEALRLSPSSQGVEAEAALAFALSGDSARAGSLAQELGKRYPLDTQMQSVWLPAIQAQSALDRKNTSSALNALAAASSIELGQIQFAANLSCLYDVYIRGEAYLAAGQGSAATAEFQKIIDNSGIVWNCWTGTLARLGVARANALQAGFSLDSELRPRQAVQNSSENAAGHRALAAYKDFLTLWKDADPDIPILKQAKAEYDRAVMIGDR